jgi:hypothetical protein
MSSFLNVVFSSGRWTKSRNPALLSIAAYVCCNESAHFQGTVKLYRWPPPEGTVYLTESGLKVEEGGLLQDMPSNCPTDIAIRVYVLRAIGLCSQDRNGKSDPYLMVKLGSCTLTDKDNYVSQQLDPVFGRLELEIGIPVISGNAVA